MCAEASTILRAEAADLLRKKSSYNKYKILRFVNSPDDGPGGRNMS
jgi:hypothetical protein